MRSVACLIDFIQMQQDLSFCCLEECSNMCQSLLSVFSTRAQIALQFSGGQKKKKTPVQDLSHRTGLFLNVFFFFEGPGLLVLAP